MKEFTVENAGARLYARTQGEGPPLLLIHGVACDAHYYEEAAKLLETDYTVITYDRRNYTRSEAAENADYSMAVQADDAAAILCTCTEKKACIAGNSGGALIAIELMLRHPQLLKKVFLHEPPLGMSKKYLQEIFQWKGRLSEAAAHGQTMRAMSIFVRELGGTDKTAPKSRYMEQNIENFVVFLQHEIGAFLDYGEQLDPAHVTSSGISCTVTAGSEDTEGLCSRAAAEIAAAFGSRYYRVPGYHNLPFDRAAVYAEILKNEFPLDNTFP